MWMKKENKKKIVFTINNIITNFSYNKKIDTERCEEHYYTIFTRAKNFSIAFELPQEC